MSEEFNLSDRIEEIQIPCPEGKPGCLVYHFKRSIKTEDVKEFIRRLKEEVTKGCMGTSANCYLIKKEIDKLAGEKLT